MRFHVPQGAPLLAGILALLMLVPKLPGQGTALEPLEGFFSPTSAVFTPDGRTLIVCNSARTDYGMVAGRGAISRVAVAADGEMKIENARWIDGLNAPMGVALLPVAIGDIPSGAVVVAAGGRWAVLDRSKRMEDPRERATGLLFFDPVSGARLGAAYMGPGSPIETILGQAALDPGHVVFDDKGNLFLSDLAGLGLLRREGQAERPGIVRVTAAGLAALLRGENPEAGAVSFLYVPEVAGGIVWSSERRSLYWGSGPGSGALIAGWFSLPGGDFGPGGEIETIQPKITPAAGACLTPGGGILVVHTDGSLGVVRSGREKIKEIRFRKPYVVLSPGQPAVTRLADGRVIAVVPETASGGRPTWRHRIHRIELPEDF